MIDWTEEKNKRRMNEAEGIKNNTRIGPEREESFGVRMVTLTADGSPQAEADQAQIDLADMRRALSGAKSRIERMQAKIDAQRERIRADERRRDVFEEIVRTALSGNLVAAKELLAEMGLST